MTDAPRGIPYREALRLQNEEFETDCIKLQEEMKALYTIIGRLSVDAASKRARIESNLKAMEGLRQVEIRKISEDEASLYELRRKLTAGPDNPSRLFNQQIEQARASFIEGLATTDSPTRSYKKEKK